MFFRDIYSCIWSFVPSKFFNPKVGDRTISRLILTEKPSLSEREEVKFAVFSDPRFYLNNLYKKLIPFLPQEFKVLEAPNGQNCFNFSLGINSKRSLSLNEFEDQLDKRGYRTLDFSFKNLQKKDLVLYQYPFPLYTLTMHAGIYIGDERVQSRFGKNSPLIEHPLREVVPNYWSGRESHLKIASKRS